jgi:serine/threonine protein kinase
MTCRYRLQRVLGRGRHASLWLAFDSERQEDVALKIAQRGCLHREFEALRAVEGDGVVTAHDCGVLPDGRPFIAMECLAGSSFDPHEAAAALASVHRAGWVHRDIKPTHFLRRAGGSLALCDFGSACRAGARGEPTQPCVIGTPRYAAPEQLEGAPATPAADVYSLGACIFESLAGKPPFRGETLTELFSQHVRAPVPRLPLEAAHWQALVDALLAKDAARRPADGDAVLRQLTVVTGDTS